MNVRKTFLFLALALSGLVIGTRAAPQVASKGAAGANYEGTYFFETVTASTGDVVNGFVTLHRGGTLTWADQSDFGGSGFFNSTVHGTWKLTGPDEVTLRGYYYQFDSSGNAVALVRITSVGSLAAGVGTGVIDVFGPSQNPATQPPAVPNFDALTIASYALD